MAQATRTELYVSPTDSAAQTLWPKSLPELSITANMGLRDLGGATPTQIAHRFTKATPRSIQPLLEALTALGQARPLDQGRFAG